MSKKILVINGHPDPESFCRAAVESYGRGAEESGRKVDILTLSKLNFNPILAYGYREKTELETDLRKAQQLIKAADHLVFVYPVWWSTYPALLKGFIDRVFLPGFAYSFAEGRWLQKKYLKGKSARLIVTLDTPFPCLLYPLLHRSPGHHSMKKGVLRFCGVNPVKITTLGSVKYSNQAKREKWLDMVFNLGCRCR